MCVCVYVVCMCVRTYGVCVYTLLWLYYDIFQQVSGKNQYLDKCDCAAWLA